MEKEQGASEVDPLVQGFGITGAEILGKGRDSLPEIVCGKNSGAVISLYASERAPLKGSGKEKWIQSHYRVSAGWNKARSQKRGHIYKNT